MSAESTRNGGEQKINPPRLSHVVLRTTRLQQMIDWYGTVLNAQVLYQNEMLAFMTHDDEHHRIAIFAIPGTTEKPKTSAGLDHVAFFYRTVGEWLTTYERLKAAGIVPRASVHHGVTMSIYYRDPDNNGVELGIDGIPQSQWHEWMRSELGKNIMGAPLDPDELARKYHAGAPEEELLRFKPVTGPESMETIRRLME